MIKILSAAIALAIIGIISSPRAEAGHSCNYITYHAGYAPNGCKVYTKRYLRGYDCHGRPVFTYARSPLVHGHPSHSRPRHYSPRPRAIIIPRAIPCPPPRVAVRGYRPLSRSSGVSFRFSFGGRR